MSDDFYIGLSRAQIEALLRGETVGKRPYSDPDRIAVGDEVRYCDWVRVHICMLTSGQEALEPKAAFGWS